MTNQTVEAGTVLHTGGRDRVQTLDIVAKGMVRATNDYCSVDLPPGSIIGIGELPGEEYVFTYEAAETTTLFSYAYESEASLVAFFKSNTKLLSTLVAGCVRFAKKMQSAVLDTLEYARAEYARINQAIEEYPALVINSGSMPRQFDELRTIVAPEMQDRARGWHRDFVDDLCANESAFKKEFYAIPSIALGIGLTVNSYALESRDFMLEVLTYLRNTSNASYEFMKHYHYVKERVISDENDRQTEKENADPSVAHPLTAIKEFAHPNEDILTRFHNALGSFIESADPYSDKDEARKLRRELSDAFYDLYLEVFPVAAVSDWAEIPKGVRMFLLFGYVDEMLAGSANTVKLTSIASSLVIDEKKKVLSVYEWLLLVYNGKVSPSNNEFEQDFPTHLTELRRSGSITAAEEKKMLEDPLEKVRFEVKNMFALGNRITFGRITTFTPIFDKQNAVRPLENSYVSETNVNAAIEDIRNIDYSVFFRQGAFSMPDIGINSFFIKNEQLPYVILMPNCGPRASLWQVSDFKKKNTPARMVISIFHEEALDDTMIRLCAEFRWEMCRLEQGARWFDITDPSLTSMYYDYLQFYRKNSTLSKDMKDKISASLKNNANNFKKVFIADYYTYIKFESQGMLRLNKLVRSILFTFCPFTKEIMARMESNPHYASLFTAHKAEQAKLEKTLSSIVLKYNKAGLPVPTEIEEQIARNR